MKRSGLNHVYRLVWSDVYNAYIAVAEIASARGKRSRGVVLAAALLSAPVSAADLPTGGSIVAGSGSIAQSGTTLTVTQDTAKMAADWQSFSIGAGHTVNFVQPSASALALNRVLGSDVSVIQGALNANGQVFLVNPNGVLFTPSAQVNVGGLVASTLNISSDDFMAGNYRFEGTSSNAIVNQGNITAQNGGSIALIAARITNEGSLTANQGSVLMGAGSRVTLDLGGPVKIQVEQGAIDALIEQGGAIRADGGHVYLTARAAGDLVTTVINHTGITEAQTLATGESGEIYLMGDMQTGRIEVAGTLDASAPNGGNGGFIETSAAKVQIEAGLVVTTQAEDGKTGEWLIDPNDYTIAANGGDITGAQLSANLANTSITIQSVNGANTAGNGDIFVNDAITWSSGNTLLLSALRNIEINAPIDASQGAGGVLGLAYGQGAAPTGNTATYTINAPISLQSGQKLATVFGFGGSQVWFTVVNSQADLQAMSLTGNYALGSSLTFTGNWTPIGTEWNNCSTMFCGNFDGLGNTISYLNIVGQDGFGGYGMFGAIKDATVQNLTLKNASINVEGATNIPWNTAYFGAVVGVAEDSLIRNVKVIDGTLNVPDSIGTSYTGGLAGYLYGSSLGGSQLADSSANIAVSGKEYVGGLVGYSQQGLIARSYASGSVVGSQDSVGGLVGFNDGAITQSWSGGSVHGANQVGGLVGNNTGSIEDAYSIASVRGDGYDTGGLVGWNRNLGTITRTWASGRVEGYEDHGGLVGWNSFMGVVTDSFWDGDTTGQSSGIGGGTADITTRLNSSTATIDAYTQSAYTGFDFGNVWWMADGATRPFLRSKWRQNITNAHELQLVAMKPDQSYTLANDIDLAPALANQSGMWRDIAQAGGSFQGSFAPIGYQINDSNGAPAFTGVFDGQNFSISNLYIDRPDGHDLPYARDIGLFGETDGAVIKNLTLSGSVSGGNYVGALIGSALGTSTISNVHSSVVVNVYGGDAGGLIGRAEGSDADHPVTISNSSSSGNVTVHNSPAGGLVGNARNFSITDSHATGAVEGEYTIGGLVGYAYNGSISNSYATGTVTSEEEAGGLVGAAVGVSIADSYATGDVVSSVSGYSMGGLVGLAESDTTITGSYATGDVTVTDDAGSVGGLVGYAEYTSIAQSYATGNVTVGDGSSNVGGLVGLLKEAMSEADHSLKETYATGDVTAGNYAENIGGLVGQFEVEYVMDNYVRFSFATGKVTAGTNGANIGGLVGLLNGGALNRTYAAGLVSAGEASTGVGGLVGALDPSRNPETLWVAYSFWDTTTSGQSTSAGGTGKTTAEMNDITTFNSGESYTRWSFEIDEERTADYPVLKMDGYGTWLIKPQASSGGGSGGDAGGGDAGGSGSSTTPVQSAIASAQGGVGQPGAVGIFNGSTANPAAGGAPGASSGITFVEVSNGEADGGRDALGYMRVRVVNGGINRPPRLDDNASCEHDDVSECIRRGVN